MNQRTKGHNFERFVVQKFKERGFERTNTSRNASRALDNIGIDIVETPFLIQCKAGYPRGGISYTKEFINSREQWIKVFGEKTLNKFYSHPYLLFHKHDIPKGQRNRGDELTTVTMSMETFFNILTNLEEIKANTLSVL
jgi:hypothetical protein